MVKFFSNKFFSYKNCFLNKFFFWKIFFQQNFPQKIFSCKIFLTKIVFQISVFLTIFFVIKIFPFYFFLKIIQVLNVIVQFSYLFLELGLTLPHKGKMLWCSYFWSFITMVNFSKCGNFIKNLNVVSTPWKIIIPLGNSVGDHMWVIQIHLGG